MFDDFHESTRNVGMVGILLGLFVVAGFCGLGMAVMSGSESKGPSLDAQLLDQDKNTELARDELESKRRRLAEIDEFRSVAAELKKRTSAKENELKELAGLREDASELEGDLEGVQLDFEEYRQKYRDTVRASAVGETLDLSETKGEAYKKCRVLSITALHLRVMGSAGPDGIPYEELPRNIQDRFQFDHEEAEAYQTKMDAVRANLNKGIADWEKKQKERKGVEARQALVERLAQTKKAMDDKLKLSDRYDGLARDWNNKAKAYDRKAAEAKRAGRISSSGGLARKARAKASRFAKQAVDARSAANRLLELEGELQRRIDQSGR